MYCLRINIFSKSFFVLVVGFLESGNFFVKSLYIGGLFFLIRIENFSSFVVKDWDVIMLLF